MVTDMKRLGILFIGLLWASISATASAEETSVRTDIFYGVDPNRPDRDLQTLDVFYRAEASNQPVIIYIHGGGWPSATKMR